MAYIKLEDAINHIKNHTPVSCSADFFEGQMDCIGQLKSLPTADVEEVKHGKWVFSRKEWSSNDYSQDVYYKCSNCGKEYEEFDIDEANYCPNCGAKMGDVEE